MMIDWIIGIGIAAVIALAVRGCILRKKKGSSCCGGNCSCCSGCGNK